MLDETPVSVEEASVALVLAVMVTGMIPDDSDGTGDE